MDKKKHVVRKYNARGKYLAAIGSPGNGDGEFHYPLSVAVDAATSELVVLDMKEAKLAAPKPGPRAVPEPVPAPRTEGATALKPEPEMMRDEAVSLVAEPLPFKPRAAKGTTTMGTTPRMPRGPALLSPTRVRSLPSMR